MPGLGYTRNDFLIMLIIGVVFFGIFTLVAGPLAERFGRRKTLIWVTLGIIVFGLLFVPLFAGGTVGTMALLIVGFTLMGLTFGPMGAELPELFPTNVRYTGSAISLQPVQRARRGGRADHRGLAVDDRPAAAPSGSASTCPSPGC